ncbi:MAG: hypothetical protein NZM31_11450 [Gemmatales bacterium]|nr:hypothetical protein [Gemmatales bacterium]MDW8387613.1 hypothetical protein [Gemmatales bacterium]
MRQVVGLAGAFLFSLVNIASAAEPPHLDLVRGLRERGLNDLAVEYLKRLQARENPPLPPDLKAVLPLEIARSQLAEAQRIADPFRREEGLRQVRQEVQKFLTDPTVAEHPRLGEARYELGYCSHLIARIRAGEFENLPRRDRNKAIKLKEAVALYDEANKAYADAAPLLEKAWKAAPEDAKDRRGGSPKQAALDAYLTCLLQQGIALYEKGNLVEQDDLKASADALKAASDVFELAAGHRDRSPVGWQALAWQGRCWDGSDDRRRDEAYLKVMNEKRAEAVPAQRLVRYFQLVSDFKRGGNKQARVAMRQALERWLADYAGSSSRDADAVLASREGQHVRLMLGLIYLEDFKELSPSDRKAPLGQNIAEKARALFAALEDQGGEYALPAKALKFDVLRRSGQVTSRPIHELRTFDDCLLRARLAVQDAVDLNEELANADDDAAREEIRRKIRGHYETARDAMQRGLFLMPEDVKEEDWEAAYQLLYASYFRTGDLPRAAVLVEYMARHARNPESARKYAVEALNLYRGLAAQSRSKADNERLIAIAEWLEKRFPDAPETDTARGILGFALLQQNHPREAAAMWEKVSPRSPSYAEFSYRAGIIYWSQHILSTRENKQPIQTPSPDRDKAIALLERSITSFDAAAKMHELNPDKGEQDNAKAAADLRMAIKARLVLADIYNYIGETDKVLTLVQPLVEAIKNKKLPEDLPPDTEPQALGLALRAHVAKKDINSALAVLDILQKHGAEEGSIGGLTDLLRDLGRQIRTQIEILEAQGEGAAEQLQKTRESFREFLGHLEKSPNLAPDLKLWVGTSYVGLGDHARAAQVFSQFTDPGPNGAPQLRQIYNQSQYLRVRSARLAAVAEKDPVKRKAGFSEAERLLKQLMQNPNFGKHPSFLAEEALLLQDQGRYSGPDGAIAKWDRLIKGLEPHLDRGPIFKNTYNEALYNRVVCIYMEGKQSKDKTVQTQALEKAARALNPIKRNNWGGPEYQARYEALLNDPKHKDLKEAFEKLQKELQ